MEYDFFFFFCVKGEIKKEQGDPGIKPLKAGGCRSVRSTIRSCALACSPSDQLRNPAFSSL